MRRQGAIAALLLFSSAFAQARGLGSLEWRHEAATLKSAVADSSSSLGKQLRGVLKHATEDVVKHPTLAVVAKIDSEGVLPTDPKHQASDQALKGLPVLFRFALCARIGEGELGQECLKKAGTNLLLWAKTYLPSGNPINDSKLLLAFVAADLLMPLLSPADQESVKSWLRRFGEAGDQHFSSASPSATIQVNNHRTWSLAVRSLAAAILKDEARIKENLELITAHSAANLQAPPHWKPDVSCPNVASEISYGGFDFRQRDALHYHVYNLQAWSWILLFTPSTVAPSSRERILAALEFLHPYFVQEKTHSEFVCTKVEFDKKRRQAGIPEFQNQPWKPERARTLLRLTRAVVSEIRPWTGKVAGESYDPWVKAIAEIQGL